MVFTSEIQFTVLIADDDSNIIQMLHPYLSNEGYRVLSSNDGIQAYQLIQNERVDLGIFEIMMPGMNGHELIQKIRENDTMPIIILSANQNDADKILALDLGADVYLEKPAAPQEVAAYVRAVLRRSYTLSMETTEDDETELIYCGEMLLDPVNFQFFKNGREISLTPTEMKILMLMMKNPGRIYSKSQICKYLYGIQYEPDENTIPVHISNLREKIEEDSKFPKYLLTIRGYGYKFCHNQ